MEELHINNTSWDESFNDINICISKYQNSSDFNNCFGGNKGFILHVSTWITVCISLPLILLAIYSLCFLVRKDHGAPVYVINLLISDIIQLLCMTAWVTNNCNSIFFYFYFHGLVSSVGFMVCISLERYLVIVWPLWYRFRRTIKTSVVVCVLVWILPPVFMFLSQFNFPVSFVIFLLPLLLFIFFLGGTLKALSASISVSSDEKRRIVAVLVVVLLIYTLLFLPINILSIAVKVRRGHLQTVSRIFIQLSPLADLILYIFMRKGITDKILASLCCCRMQLQESPNEQHE